MLRTGLKNRVYHYHTVNDVVVCVRVCACACVCVRACVGVSGCVQYYIIFSFLAITGASRGRC